MTDTMTLSADLARELLPCPFCGETPDAENEYTFQSNQGDKWGYVVCCCNGPEVRTDYKAVDHWKADAIAAWNTRTAPAQAVDDASSRIDSIRRHLQSVGAHKDYLYHCDALTAALSQPAAHVPTKAGNWPEDASHENGDYENKCMTCGETFYGHKRRVVCKLCAQPAPAQAMDGWKWVPVEPTPEMKNAAIDTDPFKLGDISPLGFRISPQQMFANAYRAMLAAAPAQGESNDR